MIKIKDISISFSGRTVFEDVNITFNLMEKGHVSVIVYDMIGEKVAILMEGEEEPGMKTLVFNALEHSSSSDVYFVKITTERDVISKKIIKKQ